MARWEGNARGRLERAALDLFREQGYDGTTVAQIARRANLTERSFYRWFTDKREVLFADDELEARYLAVIEAAPAGLGALPTLLAAFATTPEVLRPREFVIERAAAIAASPPLQERELIKMVTLSQKLVAALVRRGYDDQTAYLAAALGSTILRLAVHRWALGDDADFADLLAAARQDLVDVAGPAAG
ncbi:TetR/AcrR family transcriptional regulator [Paractinoplanes durhamensis]|uniref:TetR family transcriptional regulator n=1 Tax=Paractinoplanes durhamensis TaxID=113563 RepID=A0ABQ3Z7B3_9ACTN|nr:TetR/AcrR family transcriptional regulator [Actinoplanes durhamensis]GIE05708.1 TetR family transcriptional regulator [Actinoplanes durhamensis]